MMAAKQLGFPFSKNIQYSPQDFLVTPSNQLAYDWIQKWPHWPSHALILWGPTGCGKTHLAHVWEQKARQSSRSPHWIQPETLKDLESLSPAGQTFILDNLEEAIAHTPTEIFHLYNMIKENQGFLLCIASSPPAQWDIQLADLSSRLLSLPSVQIMLPDDDLLRGILYKRLSDLQIHTSPQVIEYILKNTDRSFEGLQIMVNKISIHIENFGGSVSIPLIKKILAV